jgi:hypothetical protein
MQTSIFLAEMLGPFFLVVGVGMVVAPERVRALAEEFLASPALIFLAGLLAFIPGLAIVLTHNVWAFDWRLIVTVLGWLGLIGGAARILFPSQVKSIGTAMLAGGGWLRGGGIGATALGLILSYFGFRG